MKRKDAEKIAMKAIVVLPVGLLIELYWAIRHYPDIVRGIFYVIARNNDREGTYFDDRGDLKPEYVQEEKEEQ